MTGGHSCGRVPEDWMKYTSTQVLQVFRKCKQEPTEWKSADMRTFIISSSKYPRTFQSTNILTHDSLHHVLLNEKTIRFLFMLSNGYSSGSRGGPTGPWPPPGPVKIGHKKDGRRRRPHRFHVSRPPPYPAAGSATGLVNNFFTVSNEMVPLGNTAISVHIPQLQPCL